MQLVAIVASRYIFIPTLPAPAPSCACGKSTSELGAPALPPTAHTQRGTSARHEPLAWRPFLDPEPSSSCTAGRCNRARTMAILATRCAARPSCHHCAPTPVSQVETSSAACTAACHLARGLHHANWHLRVPWLVLAPTGLRSSGRICAMAEGARCESTLRGVAVAAHRATRFECSCLAR